MLKQVNRFGLKYFLIIQTEEGKWELAVQPGNLKLPSDQEADNKNNKRWSDSSKREFFTSHFVDNLRKLADQNEGKSFKLVWDTISQQPGQKNADTSDPPKQVKSTNTSILAHGKETSQQKEPSSSSAVINTESSSEESKKIARQAEKEKARQLLEEEQMKTRAEILAAKQTPKVIPNSVTVSVPQESTLSVITQPHVSQENADSQNKNDDQAMDIDKRVQIQQKEQDKTHQGNSTQKPENLSGLTAATAKRKAADALNNLKQKKQKLNEKNAMPAPPTITHQTSVSASQSSSSSPSSKKIENSTTTPEKLESVNKKTKTPPQVSPSPTLTQPNTKKNPVLPETTKSVIEDKNEHSLPTSNSMYDDLDTDTNKSQNEKPSENFVDKEHETNQKLQSNDNNNQSKISESITESTTQIPHNNESVSTVQVDPEEEIDKKVINEVVESHLLTENEKEVARQKESLPSVSIGEKSDETPDKEMETVEKSKSQAATMSIINNAEETSISSSLRLEKEALLNENENLKTELKKCLELIEQKTKQLEEEKNRLTQAENISEQHEKNLSDSLSTIIQLQTDNEKLKSELSTIQTEKKNLMEATKQINQTKDKAQNDLRLAEDRLKEQDMTISGLRMKDGQHEQKGQSLTSENKRLKEKHATLIEDNHILITSKENLEKKFQGKVPISYALKNAINVQMHLLESVQKATGLLMQHRNHVISEFRPEFEDLFLQSQNEQALTNDVNDFNRSSSSNNNNNNNNNTYNTHYQNNDRSAQSQQQIQSSYPPDSTFLRNHETMNEANRFFGVDNTTSNNGFQFRKV